MQLISLFFISVFIFILFAVVMTGIGLFLLSFFKKSLVLTSFQRVIIANALAFSLIGTALFLGGQVIDTVIYYFLYLFIGIGLFSSFKERHIFSEGFKELCANKRSFFLSVVSAIIMASTLAFSWIYKNDVLYIQNGQVHDSVWHIALINNLERSIPPVHPSSYEQTLTHYHYFYDIIIAGFSKVFFVAPTQMYFQILPLYLTLLLSFSILLFAQSYKTKYLADLILLFTFYGGAFTYILPFILDGHSGQESSFWVSQTFSMMLNPQLIYSFSLVFIVLFLIKQLNVEKKVNQIPIHILIMFFSITSIGFKSYSFVVLLIMYFTFLGLQWLRNRSKKPIVLAITTLLASIPLYILVVGLQKEGTFFYSPLWYVNSMIEAQDRLNIVKVKLTEDFYRAEGELIKVYIIKAIEIVVFYVGNLGSRILFLLLPIILILNRNTRKYSALFIIVAVGFTATTVFPLLFLQTGTVWNSIQFWYYGLILANILAAFTIGIILENLEKRHSKLIGFSLVLFLIFITIIPFLQTMPNKIPVFEKIEETTTIPLKELTPDDKVLVCAKGWHMYTNSLVLAMTKAQPYFADVGQLSLTGTTGIAEKEYYINDIFDDITMERLQTFIEKEGITAIVCKKDENEGKLRSLQRVKLVLINDD